MRKLVGIVKHSHSDLSTLQKAIDALSAYDAVLYRKSEGCRSDGPKRSSAESTVL